ncbi:MAG TPA: ABC transporter permease [bacterium]|nr:ABC transporter permease [bacterium]HQG45000.1 ABC transporter permease [bacterium]HQI48483.1 ABC transporter permease [bacterium]HQJ64938.1 ABC transporter permease [bacterium]
MIQSKIHGWWSVVRREVRRIHSDTNIFVVILLAPLFYAFFYGSIYSLKSEWDVPIAIVDQDHSQVARDLIRYLDSSKLVRIAEQPATYAEAVAGLMEMRVHGIVYIPEDFSVQIKRGRTAHLPVYLNTSRFLIANDISKAVAEVSGTLAGGIRLHFFESAGFSRAQALEMIEPLEVEHKALFNPTDSYGDFLIPGLLVMILQQTLLIGLAESVAKEREFGTLGELYRISGKSTWAVMSGKGFFYLVLYLAYAFFFYGSLFALFRIPFRGSITALALLTVLFLLAVIYFSLFISSFFGKKIVAMQFFVFTSYPLFLLSGYSWPLDSMPWAVRSFSQLLPCTPYLQAFVRITQMGAGWRHVSGEFLHLALLTLIGLAVARWRIRGQLRGVFYEKKSQD